MSMSMDRKMHLVFILTTDEYGEDETDAVRAVEAWYADGHDEEQNAYDAAESIYDNPDYWPAR